MATTNPCELDISNVMFRPISSQTNRPKRPRPHYNSAKVAPAISSDEELSAPYEQVKMYERWIDDCKIVKVVPSTNINKSEVCVVPSVNGEVVKPFEQVPMYERWNW
jgi:hypothetical protein